MENKSIKKDWKWMEETWPDQEYGWKNGVYEPRKPNHQEVTEHSLYFSMKEEYTEIKSRIFTETEETGFGIYCYENTAGLYIPCETKNAQIKAVFTNPTKQAYNAYIREGQILKAEHILVMPGEEKEVIPCETKNAQIKAVFTNPTKQAYNAYIREGQILKAEHILVMPGEEKEVTFTVCPVKPYVFLKFCVHSHAQKETEAIWQSVFLKTVELEYSKEKQPRNKQMVYLVSDSTVQTYEPIFYPQTGWGEVFCRFFGTLTEEKECECSYPQARTYVTEELIIENRSIGGRSSRSFYEEGKWDEVLEQICPGDYVFVQWGHNDNTAVRPNRYVPSDQFEEWMQFYVDGTKQRGGICVLVTPVARYHYEKDSDGKVHFISDFEGYRQVMLKMAKEQHLPLIDLTQRSLALCDQAGEEGAAAFFLRLQPGETDGHYKEGVSDSTHLQRYGALKFAQCVAEGILESDHEDLKSLKEHVIIDEKSRVQDKMIKKITREKAYVPMQFTYSEFQISGNQATFLIAFTGVEDAVGYRIYEKTEKGDCILKYINMQFTYSEFQISGNQATFLIAFTGVEDAVGYRIYEKTEKGDCILKYINEEEKESLDARAMATEAGKTHIYYMTAVFADGTESGRSKELQVKA